ncbi:MAG: hypothetical protein P4L46_17320 [Fimbriimonas sp.]|nr:hypothetical protein [Fimbriimonas sp.]
MEKPVEKIRSAGSRRVLAARQEGLELVTIVAGDIVRELGLKNRTPSVCEALSSTRFLTENGIALVRAEGPPSGHSTTMKYTYRLKPQTDDPKKVKGVSLLSLRGAGKDVFSALGGGEAFLKSERANFDRK